MRFAATIAADSTQLVGLGRAPRVALLDVTDGTVTAQQLVDTHWDVLHDQAGEGSHHARIVTFLRDNAVEGVMAAHAGPPMVNTISKMGLPFLTGQGDAVELAPEAFQAVNRG